jgi:hypothetical protein
MLTMAEAVDAITEIESELDEVTTVAKTVHDLRNIFCVIICNLELLRDHQNPGTSRMIERAMAAAQRVEVIIAGLTALSKAR